ncbi:MAG: VOC family protein [Planctomycetes bacterium]|nr:VOC family protein [Planctomycetota bacterium]MBI3844805.1 VOC family protein [Planctomycetota bacterium]
MASSTKGVPAGSHTVTPHMIIKDPGKAIEFYKKAFGATEIMRMNGPGGVVMHAEIKIGDSIVYLAGENPQYGCKSPQTLQGTPVSLHLYVENVDASFKRAVEAGATVQMPVTEMFWGDRFGKVADPFGHEWSIATRVKDMTPAEMAKAQEAFFKQMATAGSCKP